MNEHMHEWMNAIILQEKDQEPNKQKYQEQEGKETTGQLQHSTSARCDGRILGILNTFSGVCGGQNHFPVLLRTLFGSSAPLIPLLVIQKQWKGGVVKMLAPPQESSSYNKQS